MAYETRKDADLPWNSSSTQAPGKEILRFTQDDNLVQHGIALVTTRLPLHI
jgi:hypothetical protein